MSVSIPCRRLALSGLLFASSSCLSFQVQAAEPVITLEPIRVVAESEKAPVGSSLNLDQPQSVGSRLGISARQTPASVSVMSADDMQARGISRAQDAVINMPGMTESPSPGNGGTSLSARGFSGHNSVAQMVDGTRLVVAAGTITYPFSTWPLERVEVLRGPASVIFGDGTIGAAVNYVTKKPIWDSSEREAFFTLGSYGRVLGGIGARGPLNDQFAYSVYVDGERSDGYRDLTDVERSNYSTALAIKLTDTVRATLSADGGVHDAPRYFGTPLLNGKLDKRLLRTNFNVADSVVSYDDQIYRAKIEAGLQGNVQLRSETWYMTTDRHWRNAESARYINDQQVSRSDFLEILHDQKQVGNRTDLSFAGTLGSLPNKLVIGVEWNDARLTHTNNSPYTSPQNIVNPHDFDHGSFVSSIPTTPRRRADLESKAVFMENALDLASTLKLITGVRYEELALESRDLVTDRLSEVNYYPATGRVGLVWDVTTDMALYGQLATGTDPLSGALSLPGGRTDFDLTEGRQAEMGMKVDAPAIRGQWTAAVYRIEKRDLLSRDPVNPNITQQIGRVTSDGIELAVASEPLEGWTLEANLAALRAQYKKFDEVGMNALGQRVTVDRSGQTLSGIPERTANLWTSWRFLPQWTASAGARYVGTRPTNAANTDWLPSYTVSNVALGYEYSKDLNFSLQVDNVTDRLYAVSGSGNTRWLLGEPRTVALTTRLSF